MTRTSTRIPFYVVFFLLVMNAAGAQVNKSDSLALVDLYNNTGGNKWTRHANWLTTAPVASWEGITVDRQKVTVIYLAGNNLKGKLPASFGNLDSLVSLYLNGNDLQGGLPQSFSKLMHLGTWIMSDNPNLGARLTSAIGNLVNLQFVRLDNTGTKGSLPKEIGRLTQLSYLDISKCALTGKLPSAIGKLSQLQTLTLATNSLSGTLPSSVGNLSNLRYLGLNNNQFSGSLPASGNLPLLQTLLLNNNEFSGSFPGWFSKAASLYTIDISHNGFTGTIPDELQNITNFYSFTASYNHFSGIAPGWLFNKHFLFDVYLDHNELTQPDNSVCIQTGSTTDYLDISNNRYTFNGLECINADNFFYFIAPQAPISIHLYNNGLAVSAGGTLSNNTYKWYKVGASGSRTIVGDSTITPNQSGSYYAKVTNASVPTLTLYTDTFVYTKSAVTAQPASLFVYPNPARNSIRVSGLNAGVNVKIAVADLTGYVWMTTMSQRQAVVLMDVSRLKSGSYLLAVTDGREVRTMPFVKE